MLFQHFFSQLKPGSVGIIYMCVYVCMYMLCIYIYKKGQKPNYKGTVTGTIGIG